MMSATKIKDVISKLELFAPVVYQEDYDNSGLLVGDEQATVSGILATLDCTEEIVEKAVSLNCNLIISHHPPIFKNLKRLTGENYVERTVLSAIRNNIAIYSGHTNFDNVYLGVNKKIADKLNLKNTRILKPKVGTLCQLITFVPNDYVEIVLDSLYKAGAGQIGNYKNCSFRVVGHGTFKPSEDAKPFTGEIGKQESVNETRIELIFPTYKKYSIINALFKSHPYEEVAYYINRLENDNQHVGAGIIGETNKAFTALEFLNHIKKSMKVTTIRHTELIGKPIQRVAVCGGSGSFLLSEAIKQNADLYLSADFKYHEFFDSENKIIIADVGHYESERFTTDLFVEVLNKNFPTFADRIHICSNNPISYL